MNGSFNYRIFGNSYWKEVSLQPTCGDKTYPIGSNLINYSTQLSPFICKINEDFPCNFNEGDNFCRYGYFRYLDDQYVGQLRSNSEMENNPGLTQYYLEPEEVLNKNSGQIRVKKCDIFEYPDRLLISYYLIKKIYMIQQ